MNILRNTGGSVREAEVRGELRGPVALGCYTSRASNVLPALLEGMRPLHSEAGIGITVGDHTELLAGLENGSLDRAIVYYIGLPSSLQPSVVYQTEVLAVLAGSEPLAQPADVDLADLVELPLIMLDTAPSTGYTELMFSQRDLKPRIGAVVPQIGLARALVGRGLGYSLLMSRPHRIPVSSEGRPLVTCRLRPRSGVTSVVAIWSAEARLSQQAQAVLGCSVEALKAADPR